MVNSISLADAGLALDVVGALLIYFNGLAPGMTEEGNDIVVVGPANTSRARRRKWASIAGITLLVIGFSLQALSNHI